MAFYTFAVLDREPLTCGRCGYETLDESAWRAHILDHEDDDELRAELAAARFTTAASFRMGRVA